MGKEKRKEMLSWRSWKRRKRYVRWEGEEERDSVKMVLEKVEEANKVGKEKRKEMVLFWSWRRKM